MNLILSIFLIFTTLSLTTGQPTTIGELQAELEPLKRQVDFALAGYKKHKYIVFQSAVKALQPSDLVKHLPDNTTLTFENFLDFQEVDRLRFIYPILVDPVKFSEALKLNALEHHFYGDRAFEHEVNLTEPILVDLIDTILEINEEEKTADFNRTNLELDELYYGLHSNPSVQSFSFLATSGYYQDLMASLLPLVNGTDKVHKKVIQHVIDFNEHLVKLPEVLPLDNRKRVEKAAIFVNRLINLGLSFESSLLDAKIACGGGRCEFSKIMVSVK